MAEETVPSCVRYPSMRLLAVLWVLLSLRPVGGCNLEPIERERNVNELLAIQHKGLNDLSGWGISGSDSLRRASSSFMNLLYGEILPLPFAPPVDLARITRSVLKYAHKSKIKTLTFLHRLLSLLSRVNGFLLADHGLLYCTEPSEYENRKENASNTSRRTCQGCLDKLGTRAGEALA